MDRQTRRANFKNLQQETKKLRSTRSSKAAAASNTSTLSSFFATPPERVGTEDDTENRFRDDLLPKAAPSEVATSEPRIRPIRNSNVFEPPGPKPKKAPKLKGSGSSSSASRRGRGRSKQQPSISNFLRNEQIFAEVTAQHCMADNFSPDDIEMALALSKSEAEKHGRLRLNDDDDAPVDVVIDCAGTATENVRRRLQKYGFRTAAKEDYNSLAVLPGVSGRGSRRCKWANKFTPLTLRNPELQQKKLEGKVSAILAQQVRTKELSEKERLMPPYKLISSVLRELQADSKSAIVHEPCEGPVADIGIYFVSNLIEVSHTPAHHLLKDWAAIQGRDLSPERISVKTRQQIKQMETAYNELEKHYENKQQVEEELDELEKLLVENLSEEEEEPKVEVSSTGSSPLKEPPDKRAKMVEDVTTEDLKPSSIPTHSTARCVSPDLFADSDEEPVEEPKEVEEFSWKVYKNITTSESASPVTEVENTINNEPAACSEVYSISSDEVKTVRDATPEQLDTKELSNGCFIDLTQEQSTPEFDEPKADLSADIMSISQAFESGNLNCSLAMDSSCQKYKLALSGTSFTTPNDTNPSCSFSDLNFSRSSFRRSVSLSTDNSFKSPLNWKLNSFSEKPALSAASPFSMKSDASIDLTQNDESDEDNDLIMLSDEEINYSIWKANKTGKLKDWDNQSSHSSPGSSPVAKKRAVPYFKTEEDLDAFLLASPTISNKSQNSRSPNKSALSRERAEFGILDAAHSEPFTLSQIMSPAKEEPPESHSDINWLDASFLDAPIKPLSRKRSHKFNDLLVTQPDDLFADEFDDFDQLVFPNCKQSTIETSTDTMPSGLDRLLTGEIRMSTLPELATPKKVAPAMPECLLMGESREPTLPDITTPKKASSTEPEQLEVNGNVYTVRVCNTPKPDFTLMPESEILQQLYNYGIKPLKRKQAVKMLEFIYNQTHPIMQPVEARLLAQDPMPRSKSTPAMSEKPRSRLLDSANDEACLTPTEPILDFKFNTNASGQDLLRFSQSVPLSLSDNFEFYVLQTNVTKKTAQPLLPLHIAWHNLLCANPKLHESVLMYEPIDLQEVYLHLKQMGHRYEPKDLKCFFDRRCIIFRYELAGPAKQAERHVRKKPIKATTKRS
ncbi:structure-specific endonuclease subunit SLX4 [Drosophila guanche]|uniref:Structure-specific endonuclease subunit SLX4 n=1 Tax=Drosophila guanche TaxID=7266 RepID=A0A3B0J620_DROGU|nr:structure-specific endonuclease subunit SLX4 [Drosophila guanche]SPP77524.1 blast:Structure-specific endonuclease subunit SLX4 [Drosophila guanche]